MRPCLLPSTLRLQAIRCRLPSLHSRLPHHARSLALTARLAKDKKDVDKSVEATPTSKKPSKKTPKDAAPKKAKSKKDTASQSDAVYGEIGVELETKARRTRARSRVLRHHNKGSGVGNFRVKARHIQTGVKARHIQTGVKARRILTNGLSRPSGVVRKFLSITDGAKPAQGMSLKEALLGVKKGSKATTAAFENLDIKHLNPEDLDFAPVEYKIPPVPRLSYGLDRVLFNPGVYRLQDPRTRVFNFDPYLEKIMSVEEFNFAALSEYKTSSKDEELLALTQREGTKFTGSTSSMSGVLQHFHFLLSNFRPLNFETLSSKFPKPSNKFSKITVGPSAIFLRWKDGVYAIDADKAYDGPNIMSWLGHSLEKLLTVERKEFERYRRSSGDAAPGEDESARCYHYSKLGNFLMRSQLDAHDPRLPGTGIFDLKTRAVVSIRMNHQEYETGKGYQLRYDHGQWQSYEREFYDMARATMLKYSLQVRMGRMDGIFIAYHNIDRIFGFQYLPLEDMDNVLHGQKDTCLGDQEFKMSISILDELMQKATEKFPEQTLRMHFHANEGTGKTPFMYIFVEPVTEEQADKIQNKNQERMRAFERDVVGIQKDDPALQAEWQEIQGKVNEEVERGEVQSTTNQETDVPSSEEATGTSDKSAQDDTETTETPDIPKGPLIGWTLAVRHRLNGQYVKRPENLTPHDSWKIEYHIQELGDEDKWTLYEKVKTKRNKLIGEIRDSEDKQSKFKLENYRKVISQYTEEGRKWRTQQDELAAQSETKVFEPLGPGSEAEAQSAVQSSSC